MHKCAQIETLEALCRVHPNGRFQMKWQGVKSISTSNKVLVQFIRSNLRQILFQNIFGLVMRKAKNYKTLTKRSQCASALHLQIPCIRFVNEVRKVFRMDGRTDGRMEGPTDTSGRTERQMEWLDGHFWSLPVHFWFTWAPQMAIWCVP